MIENIIDAIKESEKKAKEIIADSKKEASSIVEQAYSKSYQVLDDARKESKDMIKQSETRAAEEAKKRFSKLKKEYEVDIKSITGEARTRQDQAINRIINKIFD